MNNATLLSRSKSGRRAALPTSSLLFGLLLAPLLAGAPGCAFLSSLLSAVVTPPTLSFQEAKLRDLSLDGLTLELHYRIDNPNDLGLRLASVGYGLELDGHSFAKGVADQGVELKPQGSSELTLPFSIRYLELGQALEALFSKQQLPWKVAGHFGFDTPAGVIRVPFQREGQLPVPRLPKLQIVGAKLASLSLTGATLQLQLDLQNPNSFALPMSRLNYHIKVAGQEVAVGAVSPPSVQSAQSGRVTIPVQISFLSAGRAVYQAISSGEVDLGLDGGLGVGTLNRELHLQRRVRLSR